MGTDAVPSFLASKGVRCRSGHLRLVRSPHDGGAVFEGPAHEWGSGVVHDERHSHRSNWRMHQAKSLLRDGVALVEVAARVGYESDTALSRAFKRSEGLPPGVWRHSTQPQLRPCVTVERGVDARRSG